jgi:hypothetical protein
MKSSLFLMTTFSTALAWAGIASAATFSVSSIVINSNYELFDFVAGGVVYQQASLIQPRLTAFTGVAGFNRNLIMRRGSSVPSPGSRSLLLTHDFLLDTGIINPGYGDTAAILTFTPPLVNGPGPDLVMFELDGPPPTPDPFQMRVNGNTVTYNSDAYNTPLIGSGGSTYRRVGTEATTLDTLENDVYDRDLDFSETLYGIAIDLDDFGVGALNAISSVSFGSLEGGSSIDPVLFMGIASAPVPEPESFHLIILGILGLFLASTNRRP